MKIMSQKQFGFVFLKRNILFNIDLDFKMKYEPCVSLWDFIQLRFPQRISDCYSYKLYSVANNVLSWCFIFWVCLYPCSFQLSAFVCSVCSQTVCVSHLCYWMTAFVTLCAFKQRFLLYYLPTPHLSTCWMTKHICITEAQTRKQVWKEAIEL